MNRTVRHLAIGLATLPLLAWAQTPTAAPAVTPAAAPTPLPVVASFSILGDVVAQVGGPHIALTVLVGPGSDAHVHQPTPAQARAVGAARVVFSHGMGFEGWMPRLLRSSGFKGAHVLVSEGLKPLRVAGGTGHTHGHAHDSDPHTWQAVPAVVHHTGRVADALCRADAATWPTVCASCRRKASAPKPRLRPKAWRSWCVRSRPSASARCLSRTSPTRASWNSWAARPACARAARCIPTR